VSARFSHSEPHHSHECGGEAHHDHDSDSDTAHRHHCDEAGHDSDHHDAETHDHLSEVVLVKKDPSADLQDLPDLAPLQAEPVSVHLNLGVEPFNPCNGADVFESSLPVYLRAHVLLI